MSLVSEAKTQKSEGNSLRRSYSLGVLLVLVATQTYGAFFEMYRSFSPYDDEGYVMLTVKQFMQGHRLYGEIFTQYGPFYYLYKAILHGVTGLGVTHDSIRLFTLATWIATPLACAWSVYRVSKSVVLSAAVQLLIFWILRASTFEPGHPIDLCGLLLAMGMLLCTFVGEDDTPTWVCAGFGILFAALTLTKINLGAFWAAAIGATLLVYGTRNLYTRILLIAAIASGAVLPFAVMRAYIHQPSIGDFAGIVAISFLAIMACAYVRSPELFRWKNYGVVLASAASTGSFIIIYIIAHGTTLSMLLHGVLLDPWHWVGTFVVISPVMHVGMVYAAIALGVAAMYAVRPQRSAHAAPWVGWLIGLLKLTFGVGVFAGVATHLGAKQFPSYLLVTYAVPFVFLTLLPQPGERKLGLPFYRLAWCLVAVFQTLQAYPVAGSDAVFSIFPLIPVAAICIFDFCKLFASVVLRPLSHSELLVRVARPVAVLSLILFYISSGAKLQASYLANEPLNLPGTRFIRLPKAIGERYRRLTADLKTNSDVFVSMPGLESFYFWAGQEPPTCRNVGLWMTALSVADQQQIVAVLEQHPRAAVIYSPELVNFWVHGPAPSDAPLVHYIFSHFETVDQIPAANTAGYWQDTYQFMLRSGSGERLANGEMAISQKIGGPVQ